MPDYYTPFDHPLVLSDENAAPGSVERTLKVRVAAAEPACAARIERVLTAWRDAHAGAFDRCAELACAGATVERIYDAVVLRQTEPRAHVDAGVLEGAFYEWIRACAGAGPSSEPDDGDDSGETESAAARAWSAAATDPRLASSRRRSQFHLSAAIRASVSRDNSEITLAGSGAGGAPWRHRQHARGAERCRDDDDDDDATPLRFRVFSMGRKSIRRLMRDAHGRRSDVKHLGISLGAGGEYYFYLCYDGCVKRKAA